MSLQVVVGPTERQSGVVAQGFGASQRLLEYPTRAIYPYIPPHLLFFFVVLRRGGGRASLRFESRCESGDLQANTEPRCSLYTRPIPPFCLITCRRSRTSRT